MTVFTVSLSKTFFKDLLVSAFLRLWMKKFSMEVMTLYITDAFIVDWEF
jgi:hypothetical protein